MTREPKATRAWLGLNADADEVEVEQTRARLEEFLADAPPELAGWARGQADAKHIHPTPPATPASTGTVTVRPQGGRATTRRRRSPLVPLGLLAAATAIGVLVYNMPADGDQAVAGPNPTASAPADAMHAAGGTQSAPPLDQAKVDELTKKIEANPKDTKAMKELANEYSRAAHYEKASQTQAKIVGIEPKNTDARLALGVAHFNKGDFAQAEKEWNTVLAQDPKSVEAYYDLGFLYFTQDPPQIEKAEAAWKKVVELDPNSDVAKTVSSHIDSFKSSAKSSAGGSGSTSPTAVPTATATQG